MKHPEGSTLWNDFLTVLKGFPALWSLINEIIEGPTILDPIVLPVNNNRNDFDEVDNKNDLDNKDDDNENNRDLDTQTLTEQFRNLDITNNQNQNIRSDANNNTEINNNGDITTQSSVINDQGCIGEMSNNNI